MTLDPSPRAEPRWMVGIALGEGKFPPLQLSVVDFFPEYADRTPENANITFQHLLTMSLGLLWNESKPWDDPANNGRLMLETKDSIAMSWNSQCPATWRVVQLLWWRD